MTPTTVVISEIERLLYLKSLPLAHLDAQTLRRMAAHLTERTFGKGEQLLALGTIPERFFVVVDGEVEIVSGAGDTQRAGSRSIFGILSALARDGRGLSAVARRKTLVLEGSVANLLREMEDNHVMRRTAIEQVCSDLVEAWAAAPGAADRLPPPPADLHAPARRLDIVERLTVIRRHTRIGTFNMDAMMELAHVAEELRPVPGDVVWRRSDPARALHIFVQGHVEGRRPDCDCVRAGCGHHLENFVALAGQPHLTDGVATSSSVLLRISVESLFDVLEDRPFMAADLLALFARLLIDMSGASPLPSTSF